jgi:tetratricopeptide (TPR) repeat protein
VPVVDYGVTAEGIPYLASDYIERYTLRVALQNHGRVPLDQCISLAKQICSGLSHAHKRNLVHGQVMPECIFLVQDRNGKMVPKIENFGVFEIADRLMGQAGGRAPGFYFYASPEVTAGNKADVRGDIYSLGCLICEMANGNPPFVGNEQQVAQQHLQAPIPDVSPEMAADARGRALSAVLDRVLSKNPDERHASADDLFRDLERADQGIAPLYSGKAAAASRSHEQINTQSLRVKEIAEVEPAAQTDWRLIGIIGGVVALVIAAGVFMTLSVTHPPKQPPVVAQQGPKPLDEQAARDAELTRYQSLKQFTVAAAASSTQEKQAALDDANAKALETGKLAEKAWGPTQQALDVLKPLCDQVSQDHPHDMGALAPLYQQYYDLARKLHPDSIESATAEFALAQALRMKQDFAGAEQHFKDGIALLEKNKANQADLWQPYHYLGSTYADQLDWKNAELWLEKSAKTGDVAPIRTSRDYGVALVDLASVLVHEKKFDEALAVLKRAEPLVRSDESVAKLWFDIKQEAENKEAE